MVAMGKVIYRGIELRQGGSFTNSQGKEVKYNPSYVLKVDEEVEGKTYERKLKIAEDNMTLVRRFQELKNYTPLTLQCEVKMFLSRVTLVPVDFTVDSAK